MSKKIKADDLSMEALYKACQKPGLEYFINFNCKTKNKNDLRDEYLSQNHLSDKCYGDKDLGQNDQNEKSLSDKYLSDKDLGQKNRHLAYPKSLYGLYSYLKLLKKWSKAMNLVGPKNWVDILETLIVDSAYLAEFLIKLQDKGCLKPEPISWDLGAGAGLPGIPLRLLWDRGEYIMVELREKRSLFLKVFLAEYPLIKTSSFEGRAEDFMPLPPKADLVVSRAFLPWEEVLDMVKSYICDAGIIVFMTLERAPKKRIEEKNFCLKAEMGYQINKKDRFIWVLAKKI